MAINPLPADHCVAKLEFPYLYTANDSQFFGEHEIRDLYASAAFNRGVVDFCLRNSTPAERLTALQGQQTKLERLFSLNGPLQNPSQDAQLDDIHTQSVSILMEGAPVPVASQPEVRNPQKLRRPRWELPFAAGLLSMGGYLAYLGFQRESGVHMLEVKAGSPLLLTADVVVRKAVLFGLAGLVAGFLVMVYFQSDPSR